MAAEGEERLLTLYADIHYWFCPPTPRPASHRFDRESYVYLYQDTVQHRARIEIANHAGAPEQDAFTGYLDNAKISQLQRQQNLVTIVVDGVKAENAQPAQGSEWRLPSTDPRDEGKYLFRLHALDIYFWTKEDAATFIRSAQYSLRKKQLDIDYPLQTPHAEVMSPVVQQLENVAISDPAYQNGKTRNSAGASSLALAAPQPEKVEAQRQAADHTPLAYNPASPPAPEKRAHREKTPPPPEATGGTGLVGAAYDDMHHEQGGAPPPPPPSNPPGQATAAQAYAGASLPPHITSPTTSHGLSSPPSHPASTSPSTAHSYIPSQTGPSAVQSALHHRNDSGFALESPTAQIVGRSYLTSPSQPLQHLQPHYADYLGQQQVRRSSGASSQSPSRPQAQSLSHTHTHSPPPGGYSDYNYAAAQAAHSQAAYGGHPAAAYYPTGTGDYNIHGQVYRPTEEEAGSGKPAKEGKSGPGQQPGKWEAKAERAEKGINRLLRKVEKKIG